MAEKTAVPKIRGSEYIRASSGIKRDVLAVILQPDGQYTQQDVESMLKKYLKKEVH